MIEIKSLTKSFGKNEVLKGLDLKFDNAGISAILGPNGCGKTTLIKSILGMVIPNSGQILVGGQEVVGAYQYRENIDYLPQIARFPENLTMIELIEMVKDIRRGNVSPQKYINLFDLNADMDKKLRTLSGGTRQKVNLVLALMYDSPIIILDEPTVGLDPIALIRLKEVLDEEKQKGKTILITTHIMSFVEEVSDHIVFLLNGNVQFSGSLFEIKDKYAGDTLERAIANILINKADSVHV